MENDKITPFILGDLFKDKELDDTENKEEVREELTLKVIDEVFSTKDIEVKTELSDRQIIQFTRGPMFHSIFGSPRMLQLVNTLAIYSVSKGRKGRKEFTDIAKSINSFDSSMPEELGIRKRLFG